MATRPLAERFWEKVDKNGPTHPVLRTQCWLWTAKRLPRGYGEIAINGKDRARTHRVSWEMHFGAIPERRWVLHRCDNPSCVRPDHLFLGTHLDNMADMRAKGRGTYPNRTKTHCKRGHEYTPENTRIGAKGNRCCITCERAKTRAHYLKNRETVLARGAERYRLRTEAEHELHRRRSRESMQRHRDRLREASAHQPASSQ
jgi:hypothetical protein